MATTISGFIKQIADTYDAEHAKENAAKDVKVAQIEPKTCKRCKYTDYDNECVINEAGYCSDCQKSIDRGYDIVEKAGRCANGGQLDGGTVWHAIVMENDTDIFDYSSAKPVCGARPGKRSVGWSSWKPEGRKVTCKRCLERLERMGLNG